MPDHLFPPTSYKLRYKVPWCSFLPTSAYFESWQTRPRQTSLVRACIEPWGQLRTLQSCGTLRYLSSLTWIVTTGSFQSFPRRPVPVLRSMRPVNPARCWPSTFLPKFTAVSSACWCSHCLSLTSSSPEFQNDSVKLFWSFVELVKLSVVSWLLWKPFPQINIWIRIRNKSSSRVCVFYLKRSSECNLIGNSQLFSEGCCFSLTMSYPFLTCPFPSLLLPAYFLFFYFFLVIFLFTFSLSYLSSQYLLSILSCVSLLPFSSTLPSLIVKHRVFWTNIYVHSWFWSALVLETMNDRSPYPLAACHSIGLWPRPTSCAC